MCREYAVNLGADKVGTAHVEKQGLYYWINCQCQLSGTVPCRIIVSGESEIDLGICVPRDNGFGLETRIPIKNVGKGDLQFYVRPKHRQKDELFVPITPDEPFSYIKKLKNAYLSSKEGQVGLSFKDQSLIQRDSDQNP